MLQSCGRVFSFWAPQKHTSEKEPNNLTTGTKAPSPSQTTGATSVLFLSVKQGVHIEWYCSSSWLAQQSTDTCSELILGVLNLSLTSGHPQLCPGLRVGQKPPGPHHPPQPSCGCLMGARWRESCCAVCGFLLGQGNKQQLKPFCGWVGKVFS